MPPASQPVASRPVASRPVWDRCPGLLRAHQAEDGSLVRIRIPGGQTDIATLRALSELSGEFGQGDLQLTSRGNIQIRGIDEQALAALSAAVADLGLLPSASHERVRNVVASPLTGLDDFPDLRGLVGELDRQIRRRPVLAELPGRFLFALDDGRGDVTSLAYDLGYLALDADSGVLLAGDRALPVASADAAERLVALAERFLAARATLADPIWHVRELPTPLLPAAALATVPAGSPVRLGRVDRAASVGVPLALLTPDQVQAVAAVADTVVITPWRGLVLPEAAERLVELARAGLVVSDDSPWASLSACVGAPGCGNARISTRDRARELVVAWPAPGLPVHVSGCERRCGTPRGRHADLVAPATLAAALAELGEGNPARVNRPTRLARPTRPTRPTRRYAYETDGGEIYARSFATIRDAADLTRFPLDARSTIVRMVHAAGDTDLVEQVALHPRLVASARAALTAGAPVFVDSEMLAAGVTRRRLPAGNPVRCLLNDPRAAELAPAWSTTRSAAAVSLWGSELEGAVVAIGNAPTALFHLLELVADGGPRPAAVIGIPVGFVGSAESKLALAENPFDLPYLVVHGRRGGSAICAAAVNGLASPSER